MGEEFIDSNKVKLAPQLVLAEGISAFGESNLAQQIQELAETREIEFETAQRRYSTIQLRELTKGKQWLYSPLLGLFEGEYFTP